MITLQETPVHPATPAPHTLRCPDDEPAPTRPPAVSRRLRTLGLGLLRTLATAATVTGLAMIAIFSAEAAHDLSVAICPDPVEDRPTVATDRFVSVRSPDLNAPADAGRAPGRPSSAQHCCARCGSAGPGKVVRCRCSATKGRA